MRKTILIIGHSYGTAFMESCNQYTQLFDPTRYEVTVAYLIGEPNEKIRQKTIAEQVIFLDCSHADRRGLKISAIHKVLKLCREKQFSMVICHRYKPIYIMLWINLVCRIPLLLCVMHANGTMDAISRKLLVASLLRKNVVFAGVSDAVRDDLDRQMWRIPSDRIIALNNIIDHAHYEPQLLPREAARKQLNLSEHQFVFGHIGRLVKEKDQKTLILAFARMKPHCEAAKLVIIGHGRLEAELKQLAHTLQIENDILFTGHIDDAFCLMKAFDTLILCSVKEGLPRVLLEAMMARVPTIVTRASSMPDVVGDTGFLVETTDTAEKLADTMLAVSQQPNTTLIEKGNQGYQRMKNLFSMEAFRNKFWQLPFAQEWMKRS